MTRPGVVVDTNVVVSGHLSSRPESPPVWILDAMLAARFPFLVSIALLAEYREVLLQRHIQRRHKQDTNRIDRLLTEIALNGIVVEPTPAAASPPDPGDQHLWDLLTARPGAVLVTGDAKLLANPPEGASVLSPRGFVELATRR